MTETNDTTSRTLRDDADLVMLKGVMQATGLPRETLETFLVTDDDLDALCDSVLSELAMPSKRVARPT